PLPAHRDLEQLLPADGHAHRSGALPGGAGPVQLELDGHGVSGVHTRGDRRLTPGPAAAGARLHAPATLLEGRADCRIGEVMTRPAHPRTLGPDGCLCRRGVSDLLDGE